MPGGGLWLLAETNWSVIQTLDNAPLQENGTYAVDLHNGWNIVSNPLEKDVSWAAVQAASGTDQALWRFDRSWKRASTFQSAKRGQAYYFLDNNIDELVLPYPGISSSEASKKRSHTSSGRALTLRAYQEGTLRSTVRAGIHPEAREGLDPTDIHAPPNYFGGASLRALESQAGRSYPLAESYQPPVKGHIYDIRLYAAQDTSVTIRVEGLNTFANAEQVVLVRAPMGRIYDLRQDDTITLIPDAPVTKFKLIAGPGTLVEDVQSAMVPEEVELLPNYPNPFRDATTIEYTLPSRKQVRIAVYDILGRRVALLTNREQPPGLHTVQWPRSGKRPASGVYFLRMEAENYRQTRKITLVQ